MKSTVLMKAISSERRYTAASSLVLKPTSRSGSREGLSALSASARSDGPILAAQPHVRESPVRVFFLKRCIILTLGFQSLSCPIFLLYRFRPIYRKYLFTVSHPTKTI